MFFTYLKRELANRRKQTVIVASGMGLAIALVVVVNSLAAGIQDAQSQALESVYGVGTDITVTEAAQAPSGGGSQGQKFSFGSSEGATSGDSTTLSKSQLRVGATTTAFDSSALDTVSEVSGVSAVAGTLSLTNTSFNGEIPTNTGTSSSQAAPPSGGTGSGGSSFNVDSFTVLGVDPTATAVGPLSSVTLVDGEGLSSNAADSYDAVLDSDYATSASLGVGDTIDIGGTTFTIIGTVTSSTSSGASTSSDVYISLAAAQALSDESGKVTTIYVQAANSGAISTVADSISSALPDLTVSTESDLASTVSGSLGTAATLISNLGTWLSVIVLLAAIAIAVLFTISGVSRRTREFGTLKAIGWSNWGIVRQVAGESLIQSLIGGIVGAAVGIVSVLIVNLIGIQLSTASTASAASSSGGGPGGGAFSGGAPGAETATATATSLTLSAPVSLQIILVAILLAALGGIVAGAFGGWRAAKLRPAEALRAIA